VINYGHNGVEVFDLEKILLVVCEILGKKEKLSGKIKNKK